MKGNAQYWNIVELLYTDTTSIGISEVRESGISESTEIYNNMH